MRWKQYLGREIFVKCGRKKAMCPFRTVVVVDRVNANARQALKGHWQRLHALTLGLRMRSSTSMPFLAIFMLAFSLALRHVSE